LKDKKFWKEPSCLLSAESQPTKIVLTQTFVGVFFIHLASDKIFSALFSETAAHRLVNRRGQPVVREPQFLKHYITPNLNCLILSFLFLNQHKGQFINLFMIVFSAYKLAMCIYNYNFVH
jgi:hypothetical protein